MTNIKLLKAGKEVGIMEVELAIREYLRIDDGMEPNECTENWYERACTMHGWDYNDEDSDRFKVIMGFLASAYEFKWSKEATPALRQFCGEWHGGQTTAFYACSSSGLVDDNTEIEMAQLVHKLEGSKAIEIHRFGRRELAKARKFLEWITES